MSKPFLCQIIENGKLLGSTSHDDPFITNITEVTGWQNALRVLLHRYKLTVRVTAPFQLINATVQLARDVNMQKAVITLSNDRSMQSSIGALKSHLERNRPGWNGLGLERSTMADLKADPKTEVQEITNETLEEFGSKEVLPEGVEVRAYRRPRQGPKA